MGYNLPANPSRNRVFVWRKLKEIGAIYYKQGLALLPYQPQMVSQFKMLAERIRELGGEASLLEVRFLEREEEARIIQMFRAETDEDYRTLLRECQKIQHELQSNPQSIISSIKQDDSLRRIVRQYRQTRDRDHFHQDLQKEIWASFYDIGAILKETASDVYKTFSKLLDSL